MYFIPLINGSKLIPQVAYILIPNKKPFCSLIDRRKFLHNRVPYSGRGNKITRENAFNIGLTVP